MSPRRTGAIKRPTVRKNTADKGTDPYMTSEQLESFCRRCVVYHQTGVYLPPDPPPTICQNKRKPKRNVRNEDTLNARKKTTFGKGRVGVSCEAYGVRHCTCCNPSLMEQLYNATVSTASTSHALTGQLVSPKTNRLTPKTNPTSSIRLDTTIEEVVNKYKPKKPPPKPTYQPIVIDDEIDFNILPETSPEPIEIDDELQPFQPIEDKLSAYSVIELDDTVISDQTSDLLVDVATNAGMNDIKVNKKSPKPPIRANESSASLSLKQLLENADKDIRNLFKKNTSLLLPTVRPKSIVDLTKPSCSTSGGSFIDLTESSSNDTMTKSPDITNKSSGISRDCPICLETVGKGMFNNIMSTVCGHIFCGDCIKSCIQLTKACPTCRKKLTLKGIHPIYL